MTISVFYRSITVRITVSAIIFTSLILAPSVMMAKSVKKSTAKPPQEDRNPDIYLKAVIEEQKLYVFEKETIIKEYPISSSKFGIGNKAGSQQTPLGKHKIAQKIGKNSPMNTIFKNRNNTGKLATVNDSTVTSAGDFITSRILWLDGLEEGINKGKNVDSFRRNIYIHGTSDEGLIGKPSSHGCIRMKNKDVVELFELVSIGTIVDIEMK